MSDDIEINTKGLEKLLKALKTPPQGRVGIFGDKNLRSDGTTNAFIGVQHEYGNSKLPVRSFLRLPLTALLDKELQKSGAFSKDVLEKVVASGSIVPWLEKVLIVAEAIVIGAFDTRGYGTWGPSNMSGKTNKQTLVETGQLRDSISSEVIGGSEKAS